MPSKKGNPDNLNPLKPKGDEPLKSQITVRITESMHQELKEATDDIAEFTRQALREKLDRENSK
jgi:hypothetical protein